MQEGACVQARMTHHGSAKGRSLQMEAPAPAQPADPGAELGPDESHLTQSARWKQRRRPSDYKQMESERSGNLQTICMTRCSFSIIALGTAITTLAKQPCPSVSLWGRRSISPRGKFSLLRAVMKNLFLATSVLLLRLYLSIAALPKINDTKNTN